MIKRILLTVLILHTSYIYSQILTVAVLCGAYNATPGLEIAAYELGQYLGAHDFGLIMGGGRSGLMRKITDGYVSQALSLDKFRNVVLKKYISDCHPNIKSENIILVESLYQRIDYFYETADLCIVLPGGFGTLHELINCLVHEKSTRKQIILINSDGCWNNLMQQFQNIINSNHAASKHVESLRVVESVAECIKLLCSETTKAKVNQL